MGTTQKVGNLGSNVRDATIANVQKMVTALRLKGIFAHDEQRAAVADTGTADLAAVMVIANALKAAWNLHLASTTEHVAADATNTTSAAAATDQGTSNTLLNELKNDFNAHIILRASHRGTALADLVADVETIRTKFLAVLAKLDADAGVTDTNYASLNTPAVATNSLVVKTADASDLATSKTLAAALLLAMNAHFQDGVPLLELVPG